MPVPVKWKDEFQINIGDAAIGVQVDPRIIGLASGQILVVWTESPSGVIGSDAGTDIIGQLYSSKGTPIGDPFQVNTTSTIDDARDWDIAATNDGGFVIVYVDDDISSANQTGIIWERYEPSGGFLEFDFDLVDSHVVAVENVAADNLANPQVTVNQLTNESLVTFTDEVGADTNIHAVTISAAGVVSAEFDAAQNGVDFNGDGDVAILANGDFVSVYRETDGAVTSAEVQIMTSTGGVIETLNLTAEAVDLVRVATLANGNWVAVWSETAVNNGDIRFQVYSPVGNPVGGPGFAAVGANSQHSPDIVALPDGGFVIVWDDDTGNALLARRFNADGTGDGTIFTVATGTDSTPDVGVTGDGRILFTWKDGGTAEIFASIWDPRDSMIDAADYQMHARNFVDTLLVDGQPTGATMDTNNIAGVYLQGGDGDDVLIGGASGNTLAGGLGNDTYFVNGASVNVNEAPNLGNDTVYASVSYALSGLASVETLSTNNQAATTAINLTGNNIDNSIFGNEGNNQLLGMGGVDQLTGYGGNDTLNGGTGADVMLGGLGDDIYLVDNANDIVTELAGQGADTVYAYVNYALAAGTSVETLSAADQSGVTALTLTGNALVNTIFGNAGDNLLNGGGGADSLRGLGGNDVYLLDNAADVVVEGANGGFDTGYVYTSYVLGAGIQLEVVSAYNWYGFEAYNFTGNELDNRLYGNAATNQFVGGNGNDMIIGFGGGDTMNGGAGNDAYYTFAPGDVIVETAGNGTDSVFSYTSFTLAADDDIEVLSTYSFGGTEAYNLTGNQLAQLVYGNAGNNILNGAAGADFLNGFGGADTFAFTTALGAGNIDTIGDMTAGLDTIALDDAIFTGLGNLADAFVTGSAAVDANDRIIYNSATGALSFDADGTGGGAAVQFATVSAGLALTASDFQVI